jgi:WD40 repeat protein/serine/threonine protein kinase
MSEPIPSPSFDPLRTIDQPPKPDESTAQLGDSSEGETPPTHQHPPPSPDSFSLPGYDILGVLGRGGMGVVYKARQTAANRIVALKMILRGEYASPSDLQRFQREAEAVARLSHPNIVSVYEVGTHQGLPYFTLEYVAGGTLAQQLAGNPQPARRAAELVEQLARAMQHAHRNGIVHRDLKPGNILLTRSSTQTGSASTRKDGVPSEPSKPASTVSSAGSRPKVAALTEEKVESIPKITDFGLARQLEVDDGQTNTGAVMGTPSYMAPEQALGLTKHVGPAADVYALGAILYECMTGLPPFKGASKLETLDQVRRRDPVPVRQLQPSIPRDLETICLKCLAKEPAKRYPTAGEFADDLQRFLQGKPIAARPVGVVEQAWKWTKRNRLVAGLLATVLVVLVAGITVSSIAWANAVEEKKKAEKNENLANETAGKLEIESTAVKQQLTVNSVLLAQTSWQERENHPVTAYVWLNKVMPEHRRWEWHYLNRLFEGSAYTLVEHGNEVVDVAFTKDGTKMFSASPQKIVQWDAMSCQPVFTWSSRKEHDNEIRHMAIDPEGRRIAVCHHSGTAVLDTATKDPFLVQRPEIGPHARIAFNAEGTILASVHGFDSQESVFRVRTPTNGSVIHEWSIPNNHILDFSFSPDGREVALATSSDTAGQVIICDYRTGRQRAVFSVSQPQTNTPNDVLRVVWSPDGLNVVCLLGPFHTHLGVRRVVLLDAVSGKHKFESPAIQMESHNTLACSPDGLLVATGSAAAGGEFAISVWNTATGQLVRELKGHLGHITSLAFSPDGSRLMSGGADGNIKCWDVEQKPRAFYLGGPGDSLRGIAARKDGAFVATVRSMGGKAGMLDLWNMTTGKLERAWAVSKDIVECVAFSPDGSEIITAGGVVDKSGEIKRWDASTGKLLGEWQTDLPCFALALSPDGNFIVSAGSNLFSAEYEQQPKAELKVWERGSGKLLHNLQTGTTPIFAIAFHPDGTHFSCGSRGQLTTWDVKSGQVLRTVHAHDAQVYRVAYSPDGKYIATGSNVSLRLWNAADGELIADLEGHTSGLIYALAFSPDATRLVSSDNRGSVRVWDLTTRQQLLKLATPDATVTGLAFGYDNCLLGCRSDGRIHVWPAPLQATSTRLEGHRYNVRVTMFSPNSAYLLSANKEGRPEIPSEVKLWDTATGRLLHDLQGLKPGGVRLVAFHPQATLVAASADSRIGTSDEIVVWDVATGQIHLHITDPVSFGDLLGFSNDGNRLLSKSSRGVKAWDLTTGLVVPAQPDDTVFYEAVAMSPDRRYTAYPVGTRIHLAQNRMPSELELSLRLEWNTPPTRVRSQLTRLHMQAGRFYAAWFEAERKLYETETPTADDFRFRDDALLAALKQCPKNQALLRSAARLLISRPETNLKASELIPLLADTTTQNTTSSRLWELGGLYLRDGKPDEAIAALKKAISLRELKSPPVPELLLALAYQSKNQPEEVRHWREQAAVWMSRAALPSESVTAIRAACGNAVAGLTGFESAPGDRQERLYHWETQRALWELTNQVTGKQKK